MSSTRCTRRSEYFACATTNINQEYEMMLDGRPLGEVATHFIRNNQCEGISYCIMPLILVLVFSAVGKVVYPETSDDISLKSVVTLNLAPWRIFQLVIGTIMILMAIVMFGLRNESRVDPWVEQLCTVYFCLVLVLFILEGIYSTFFAKSWRKGPRKSRHSISTLQIEMMTHKLEKDRTRRNIGKAGGGVKGDDIYSLTGCVHEGALAPGFL